MNQNQPIHNLKGKKVHFIGIGGIGMSALARYFHADGSVVSGSDKEKSYLISELEQEGITNIWIPHNKKNIEQINPDYIIYSTAITASNEEIIWGKERNKTLLHRADLLQTAIGSKNLISVSGTHGKTTTSAMITEIFLGANLNPSAIIGGLLIDKNSNTVVGNGEHFIIEADESDKSFLKGNPVIAVITNIEADHLENYPGGIDEIKSSFLEFASKALLNKGLIACIQDPITKDLLEKNFSLNNPKLITYGIAGKCNSPIISAKYNIKEKSWDIFYKNELKTSIKLRHPGEHNILNALAAFGVGSLVGIIPEKIKESLETYKGTKRRFQVISQSKELIIVDDYAHHPTEIKKSIEAAYEIKPKRLIIVVQPHQPVRLRDLWDQYKEVFKHETSPVYITDTFIARGSEIPGISSQKLVKEINKSNVNYLPGSIEEITNHLKNILQPEDFILIMGAGDITNLGPKLLQSDYLLTSNTGNN